MGNEALIICSRQTKVGATHNGLHIGKSLFFVREDKMDLTKFLTTDSKAKNVAALAEPLRTQKIDILQIEREMMILKKSTDAQWYYDLGVLHLRHGKYVQAISYLKYAIGLNTKHTLAHFNLGLGYERLKKYDLAYIELNIALSLEPNLIVARAQLLDFFYYLNKINEALSCIQETTTLCDPPLAEFIEVIEKWSESSKGIYWTKMALQEILIIAPNNRKASMLLAFACFNSGDYDHCHTVLLGIYEINKKDFDAILALAFLQNIRGLVFEAVSYYFLAIRIKPLRLDLLLYIIASPIASFFASNGLT